MDFIFAVGQYRLVSMALNKLTGDGIRYIVASFEDQKNVEWNFRLSCPVVRARAHRALTPGTGPLFALRTGVALIQHIDFEIIIRPDPSNRRRWCTSGIRSTSTGSSGTTSSTARALGGLLVCDHARQGAVEK